MSLKIAENTYDELGQLATKKVGGKTSQSRLQEIDYAYNVRGNFYLKLQQNSANVCVLMILEIKASILRIGVFLCKIELHIQKNEML